MIKNSYNTEKSNEKIVKNIYNTEKSNEKLLKIVKISMQLPGFEPGL